MASTVHQSLGTGEVVTDTWQHVAVTVDTALTANQVKIYLDGVDQTDDATSPNSGVTIGNGGRD